MIAALETAADPSQRGEIAVALMHPLLDRVVAGAGWREVSQALRSLPPLDDIAVEDRPRIAVYLELCRAMLETNSGRANSDSLRRKSQRATSRTRVSSRILLDRLQEVPAAADEEDMLHPALREIMPSALRLFGRGEFYRVVELLEPVLQGAEEENADLEMCLPLVGGIASALHQLADFQPEHRRQIAAAVARLLDRYTKKFLSSR